MQQSLLDLYSLRQADTYKILNKIVSDETEDYTFNAPSLGADDAITGNKKGTF